MMGHPGLLIQDYVAGIPIWYNPNSLGHAPMVLKAQIGGYDIGRIFMDTGSRINLIYSRTLKAMNISLNSLQPTDCSFHGIIPGSANYPLGKIKLDIYFGDSHNYRREK
jgi:hypothetical protein